MSTQTTSRRLFGSFIVFLTVSAIYLYAFPQANVAFAVVVLLHALLGIVTTIILLFRLWRTLRDGSTFSAIGWVLLTVGGLVGIALIWLGTSRNHWSLLYTHLALSFLGVTFLIANFARERGWFGRRTLVQIIVPLVVLGVAVPAARFLREGRWITHSRNLIENPLLPPTTMDGEGDGPQGLFFPSSAQVYGTKKIPSKYFMESDSCKRCHEDIYNQWYSSAHHFSSFNNQWYRKSIEYMQDVVGTKPSKWCGGCHDPAVLYSGLMDTPIKEIVHRPEAQAGLGCMMCHSIVEVKSTMGQGDFLLDYPKLHELAASKSPVTRTLHDFLIKLNPEPHRRTFLKPFMKEQTAEFCSSCHKVHLDVPGQPLPMGSRIQRVR
jgi:hypothetical protein